MIDKRVQELLQILCDVRTYQEITRPNRRTGEFFVLPEDGNYWKYIPDYLVSRCPFCGLVYHTQIDTYSLQNSSTYSRLGQQIGRGGEKHETVHCSHYVAAESFNELGGLSHIIMDNKRFDAKPSIIQKHLLPDDIRSYSVIHALPICSIENNQFSPRFTKYILCYFSENRSEILKRWTKKIDTIMEHDPEYYEGLLGNDYSGFDISSYVISGKLKWLDINKVDLPLCGGQLDVFPYVNLQYAQKKTRESTTLYQLIKKKGNYSGIE